MRYVVCVTKAMQRMSHARGKLGGVSNQQLPGSVLWFTGFSGAGKTTIATATADRLHALGVTTESLDGDQLRALMPAGFTPADRDAHIRRVAYLASRLEHHGVTVLCALISPYRESRDWARSICRRFIEIHVSTPLETCEARDVKGLYAQARRGELAQFTGLDDRYDPPVDPEVTLDTRRLSVAKAADEVVAAWSHRVGAATVVSRR